MYFILCQQVFMYTIQYTIDEMAALRGAVFFGNINVFVDGNLWRNGFKLQ